MEMKVAEMAPKPATLQFQKRQEKDATMADPALAPPS
jgi:hypothetical protein